MVVFPSVSTGNLEVSCDSFRSGYDTQLETMIVDS